MFRVLLKKTLGWKEHVKLLLRLILAMLVYRVIRQERVTRQEVREVLQGIASRTRQILKTSIKMLIWN